MTKSFRAAATMAMGTFTQKRAREAKLLYSIVLATIVSSWPTTAVSTGAANLDATAAAGSPAGFTGTKNLTATLSN